MNVDILYDSLTGNVQRFIDKLQLPCTKITNELNVHKPFILITFTTGFGEIPKTTKAFLEKNHRYLKAVATSGNRNWGMNYGSAADKISELYNVPIIMKFELSGTPKDVEKFIQEVQKY